MMTTIYFVRHAIYPLNKKGLTDVRMTIEEVIV